MAGSGYDISASSAKSTASGVQNQANTYFNFGGGGVTTGDSGQGLTQTPTATSTAATNSPGAGNISRLPAYGQENIQQGYTPPALSNGLLIFSAVIIAALILKH